jgi:RimJ/RimL family protein N-acetyltransferase
MGPIGWIRRRLGSGEPGDSPTDDPMPDDAPGLLLREGERVELRRQVPANQAAFQRWYADTEIAAMLRHDQKPLDDFQSRSYFQTLILPLTARDMAYAIHEKATGRLIGASALTDFSGRAQRHGYFRIVIGEKDCWGLGYGTEATRLVILDGFERHGLHEIRLEVFLENERARAAYDRVGFAVTGEHVEYHGRERTRLEVIEMAIVREDFDEALAEEIARETERSLAVAAAEEVVGADNAPEEAVVESDDEQAGPLTPGQTET